MDRHASGTVSFHCSACGRCCNSPPAMTVPELFHHERLFVGCLAVRRLPRHRPGEQLAAGTTVHVLLPADAQEADRLARDLLFEAPGRAAAWQARFALATQGLDYPSLDACPARLADGRCGIHDDRKPGTCRAVPLDPLLPDRLQHVVLMHRNAEAGYIGADCFVPGRRDGRAVLTAGGEVADAAYRDRLARQRGALAADKAAWGEEVFALLGHELFTDAAQAARVPADGFLSLPMVPVLAVLAARSERCRMRCVRYARAQIALIDDKVEQALRRKRDRDKPLTRELRGYRQVYARFIDAVGSQRIGPRSFGEAVTAAEAYLGMSASAVVQ